MERLLCPQIVIPDRFDRLELLGVKIEHFQQLDLASDAGFIRQVKGYTYVISGPGRWNKNVLAASRGHLKLAVKFGVGVDNFDLPAATRQGIAVANAPGSNALAVAEHTLALLLALVRRIPQTDASVRQGSWQAKISSLAGKTVGLVGFGHIGRQVALLLQNWPVRLLAYDIDPRLELPDHVAKASLVELQAGSDVISLHLPLNENTRNLIDRDFLLGMKKGAYLINTARGGLVDEKALAEALLSGHLAGAALDTFAREPLPVDSPLLGLDNIILTPHCASNTRQAYQSIMACCLDNIIAFKTGQGRSNILNPAYKDYL